MKGWWFEFTDKSWPHGEWRQLVWNNVVSWYYFHEDGYMATGWFKDGNHVFYLHPYSDGAQGIYVCGAGIKLMESGITLTRFPMEH